MAVAGTATPSILAGMRGRCGQTPSRVTGIEGVGGILERQQRCGTDGQRSVRDAVWSKHGIDKICYQDYFEQGSRHAGCRMQVATSKPEGRASPQV